MRSSIRYDDETREAFRKRCPRIIPLALSQCPPSTRRLFVRPSFYPRSRRGATSFRARLAPRLRRRPRNRLGAEQVAAMPPHAKFSRAKSARQNSNSPPLPLQASLLKAVPICKQTQLEAGYTGTGHWRIWNSFGEPRAEAASHRSSRPSPSRARVPRPLFLFLPTLAVQTNGGPPPPPPPHSLPHSIAPTARLGSWGLETRGNNGVTERYHY